MFSYQFYVVMHVTGLILLFSGLSGAAVTSMHGLAGEKSPARTATSALHGTGLLLLLVGGFGLMARTGIMHGTAWPTWLLLKLGIWLVMGGVLVLVRRVPRAALVLLLTLPLLGVSAVYLAKYKPFRSATPAAAAAPASADPSTGEASDEGTAAEGASNEGTE